MKKERIYVLCTKKSEWADVLRYKAAKGHVWRQSQRAVLCDNDNISRFQSTSSKGESLICLGIHEEGGETSLRVAKEKGTVISFERFQESYFKPLRSNRTQPDSRTIESPDQSIYGRATSQARPVGYEAYDGHFGSAATATQFTAQRAQTTTTSSLINNKKENNMKSLIEKFIPKKANKNSVAIAFSGKLAFLRKDGEYVRYDGASDSIEVQSILPTFKVGHLCFEMPTAIDQVKVGDVIKYKENYHEVIDTTNGLKTINLNTGSTSNVKRETIAGFGFGTIQKIVCLINSNQFGAGDQAFNPMMLALLAKDGDNVGEDKIGDLLPLMLMTQGQGANPMANMLPFLALTGKGSDDMKDLLPLMLMSQAQTPGQTANPMQAMLPLMLMKDGGDLDPMVMMMMMGGGNNPFAALTGTTTPTVVPVVEDKDAIIEALKAELAASKASKD